MSSLNTLSVVANVVQVVNFADTIFCAGKSLYDFIGRYKKFSQSIPHLLLELQSLLSIIAYVRIFLTEFANSQFSHTDGQMLPSINSILTLIEQDFRHLRSLISDTMYDTNDRWYTIISSSLKWARKEQDISGARNRIAQYTANLTAALSVSGRYFVTHVYLRLTTSD
jgi:hypothetical protein